MKSKQTDSNGLITFTKFLKFPIFFFDTLGIIPFYNYEDAVTKTALKTNTIRMKELFFWTTFIILFLHLVGEFFYFFRALGNFKNFLEITQLAPCIGFVALALVKMLTIQLNRNNITELTRCLYKIFPSDFETQQYFKVNEVNSRTALVMKNFTIIYMVLIWTFNLLPLVESIYDYIVNDVWIKRMPYFIWYPYNQYLAYVYELTFLAQIWAGYVTAAGILATDLFCFVFITQIRMQFKMLAKNIQSIRFGLNSTVERGKLREFFKKHQLLITLCGKLENVFAPSLLFNFVGSSFIICLVAFQLTAETNSLNLFKYGLFLLTASAQCFMLSWYGDQIIRCSNQIGDAIYSTNWYKCDNKLKKCLLIGIMRAQKAEKLTAMKFSVISMGSFSKIMGTAYSYFTLLRTMYQPQH